MSALLEISKLTKTYPGVVANKEITLSVNKGEIVALLGENGAGKSTLVKSVFGLVKPDSGSITIKGEKLNFGDTKTAIKSGVGMVHQHFQLVPVMTVTENLILGDEPNKGSFISYKKARAEVVELSHRYGLEIDPDAVIEDLPVGLQQRVEILKALRKNIDLLILDEPTAVLTPQETDELLQVMKSLAASGVGILFITHKLREVLAVSDRIVVLRGGVVTGEATPKTSGESDLAQMMVGRPVVLNVVKKPATPGKEILNANNLEVLDDRGHHSVNGFSITLHEGEILGIAGVEGNGQRELVEALAGMRPIVQGNYSVLSENAVGLNPNRIHDLGVAHVPEDREKDGLVSSYSIDNNLVLNQFDEEPFSQGWIRNLKAVEEYGNKMIKTYDIRTPSGKNPASSLSGGNKQKVVIARELSQNSRVIIASQPTRGVDVGSIEFIHNQLVAARDKGAGVLLVSAELDEILSLSDRVAVMYAGKIVAIFDAKDADRTTIGKLMAGASI
jgi:simple sugar transport system ATP-binding protein